MIQRISTAIDDHKLAAKGETVLVALSGGPDSVALLHVLSCLQKKYKWNLVALYINHNIRPEEAEQEESSCKQFCNQLSVECLIEEADVPTLARKDKIGLEEAGRNARYEILNRIADQITAQRIALGHHKDDQAETILFRIIRGTGMTGLTGMPWRRDRIIRPMLDISRDEIMSYIGENKLSYCRDSSNEETSIRRNFLRHKLLPMIRKDLNPQVVSALTNLGELVTEEERYLNSVVVKSVRKIVSQRSSGKAELILSLYMKQEKWLRWRLLRHCITLPSGLKAKLGPSREVIESVDKFCFSNKPSMSIPNQMHVTRVGDLIYFHKKNATPYCLSFKPGEVVEIESLGLSLRVQQLREKPISVTMHRRASRVFLDYDCLVLPLEVRTIRAGDLFVPLGMRGHKKVGNYLTDRKVPPVLRDEIPVVVDRKGIVWLVGYEIDDRVKIGSETGKVCRIECSKRRKSQS